MSDSRAGRPRTPSKVRSKREIFSPDILDMIPTRDCSARYVKETERRDNQKESKNHRTLSSRRSYPNESGNYEGNGVLKHKRHHSVSVDQHVAATLNRKSSRDSNTNSEQNTVTHPEELLKKKSSEMGRSVSKTMSNACLNILSENIYKLWKNGTLCDVILHVDGKRFYAHRLVLATASELFAQIDKDDKEMVTEYDVENTNPDVMEEVLMFLYTSRLKIDSSNIEDLLNISQQLRITKLFEMCGKFLKHVSVENAVKNHELAERYGINDVVIAIDRYMHSHFESLVTTPSFLKSNFHTIYDIISSDILVDPYELKIFHACASWIEFDLQKRIKYAVQLMSLVRFVNISPIDITTEVEPYTFIFDIPECKDMLYNAFRHHALCLENVFESKDHRKLHPHREIHAETGGLETGKTNSKATKSIPKMLDSPGTVSSEQALKSPLLSSSPPQISSRNSSLSKEETRDAKMRKSSTAFKNSTSASSSSMSDKNVRKSRGDVGDKSRSNLPSEEILSREIKTNASNWDQQQAYMRSGFLDKSDIVTLGSQISAAVNARKAAIEKQTMSQISKAAGSERFVNEKPFKSQIRTAPGSRKSVVENQSKASGSKIKPSRSSQMTSLKYSFGANSADVSRVNLPNPAHSHASHRAEIDPPPPNFFNQATLESNNIFQQASDAKADLQMTGCQYSKQQQNADKYNGSNAVVKNSINNESSFGMRPLPAYAPYQTLSNQPKNTMHGENIDTSSKHCAQHLANSYCSHSYAETTPNMNYNEESLKVCPCGLSAATQQSSRQNSELLRQSIVCRPEDCPLEVSDPSASVNQLTADLPRASYETYPQNRESQYSGNVSLGQNPKVDMISSQRILDNDDLRQRLIRDIHNSQTGSGKVHSQQNAGGKQQKIQLSSQQCESCSTHSQRLRDMGNKHADNCVIDSQQSKSGFIGCEQNTYSHQLVNKVPESQQNESQQRMFSKLCFKHHLGLFDENQQEFDKGQDNEQNIPGSLSRSQYSVEGVHANNSNAGGPRQSSNHIVMTKRTNNGDGILQNDPTITDISRVERAQQSVQGVQREFEEYSKHSCNAPNLDPNTDLTKSEIAILASAQESIIQNMSNKSSRHPSGMEAGSRLKTAIETAKAATVQPTSAERMSFISENNEELRPKSSTYSRKQRDGQSESQKRTKRKKKKSSVFNSSPSARYRTSLCTNKDSDSDTCNESDMYFNPNGLYKGEHRSISNNASTPEGDIFSNDIAKNSQFDEITAEENIVSNNTASSLPSSLTSINTNGLKTPDMPLPPIPNAVYVIGGINPFARDSDSSSIGRVLQQFDPVADRWSTRRSLPVALHDCAVTILNNMMYVTGGQKSQSCDNAPSRDCYAYDISMDRWETIGCMKTGRTRHAAVALGDKVYALGGEDCVELSMKSVESYCKDDDVWKSIEPMKEARVGLAAIAHRARLMVVGGMLDIDGNLLLDTIEVYDPKDGRWSFNSRFPVSICGASMAEICGTVYVVGGYVMRDNVPLSVDSVFRYCDELDIWEVYERLRIPRHDAVVAAIGTRLYVIGGESSTIMDHALSDVECIDVCANIHTSGASLLSPAYGICGCAFTADR